MIHQGRKVLDGPMEAIQKGYGQDSLRLRFRQPVALGEGLLEGVSAARRTGRFWEMRFTGDPSRVLEQAMRLGPVDHFEVVHPSLHDIFVRIAGPVSETNGRPEAEVGNA